MKKFSLLMLIGFFSCTQDTAIHLSNLKFPDPERAFIKCNQIDTTFIYIPQDNGSELRSYKTYDENGNILVNSYSYDVPVTYHYNSDGWAIRTESTKDRLARIDSASYELDRDQKILIQRWINGKCENRYLFNDSGRVQQLITIEFELSGKSKMERIDYVYHGALLQKSLIYINNKDKPDIENNYYYSNKGILDSTTLKTHMVTDKVGFTTALD